MSDKIVTKLLMSSAYGQFVHDPRLSLTLKDMVLTTFQGLWFWSVDK